MTQLRTDHLFERAQAALAQGRLADAEVLAQSILKQRRGDFGACMIMADIAGHVGQREDELQWIRRALTADPKNARVRAHFGRRLLHAGDLRAALRELETARKRMPDDPGVAADLITALEGLGRTDAAERMLKPLIGKLPAAPEIATVAMRWHVRRGEAAAAVTLGEASRDHTSKRPSTRRNLLFALSMAYEGCGRFDDAFAAASLANAVQPPAFDPATFTREIDRIISVTTREFLAAVPRAPEPSELPVFIVGMPRTGSTLVERMLHAHGDVHGGGECGTVNGLLDPPHRAGFPECMAQFTAETSATIQQRYLDVLRKMAPKAARIVNKELFNFWYLGLIDRTMPGARIIVCHRDPLDTCLSCFMTNLPGETVPFSFDLQHLGIVHRGVERLIAHLRSVIVLPVFDVHYESLVADPEKAARELAAFIGVEYNEAMLDTAGVQREETTASRDQVRKAIHGEAVGRAARFEQHLGPLRDALAGG